MPNQQNETLLRRILDYLSNPNSPSSEADKLFVPDWTSHGPFTPSARGPEGARQLHDMFKSVFSDFNQFFLGQPSQFRRPTKRH